MRRVASQGLQWRLGRRLAPRYTGSRLFSDAQIGSETESREGCVFVDSVFPSRISRFDFRRYIAALREETLLETLEDHIAEVKAHGFELVSLEPHHKDGGVFVRFKYSASDSDEALKTIESELNAAAVKHGGFPSWTGIRSGRAWLVKGTPWNEDMHRFPSPLIRIFFEGPDVHEETLYKLLRPYGRVDNLHDPTPVPAGAQRSTLVEFQGIRGATIASNVLHGIEITSGSGKTRLRPVYQSPMQVHVIRDWLSSHPRIVLPIVIFLFGTLTYTIFDPIRVMMVEAKMLNRFDYREWKVYKWLRTNTFDRLYTHDETSDSKAVGEEVWKERRDAESSVRTYITDMPSTIAFIHGPQGSGKTTMLNDVLKDSNRKTLIVDCRELLKASSDTELVAELAKQTGYRPVFTFLNSLNNLMDLASMGLIGQKTGMSSSLNDQLKGILEVVTKALQGVSSAHQTEIQRQVKHIEQEKARKVDEERKAERIRRGIWHDGRLDCVAGNGVMSELGIGDEIMREWEMDPESVPMALEEEHDEKVEAKEEKVVKKQRNAVDAAAVEALPIVVIRNFAEGGSGREDTLNVLAQWAANLEENQIAHVIVISDNRENSKRLAKALPTKPLNSIALDDADSASALSFVKQKLHDAEIDLDFTQAQTSYIQRLGGRASDLESLVHKVRSGQSVEEAVEDIIVRGVGELRKNAFGDDADDAKGLSWSREQVWIVLKLLYKDNEVPYHNLLSDFPFKGDESPLKAMEHAELISIQTQNGRPSTIRPGKPVFKWVFERLVNDPVFHATQDIAFNEKVIAGAEATVKACEEELLKLKEIRADSGHWWGGRSAGSMRAGYLLDKMLASEVKIESLEKKNADLKKVLAKGG